MSELKRARRVFTLDKSKFQVYRSFEITPHGGISDVQRPGWEVSKFDLTGLENGLPPQPGFPDLISAGGA